MNAIKTQPWCGGETDWAGGLRSLLVTSQVEKLRYYFTSDVREGN